MTTSPPSEDFSTEEARIERLKKELTESPQLLWESMERLGELRYTLAQARDEGAGSGIFKAAEAYRGQERRVHAIIDRTTNIIVELLKATEP